MRSFGKSQISPQNPKGLAFGFAEKQVFPTKTCLKLAFLGGESNFPIHLYIMIFLTNFYIFWKYSNLASKSKGLGFGFAEKRTSELKTGCKPAWLDLEAHFLAWLNVMMLSKDFEEF